MHKRPCDLEQAPLVRMSNDLASEELGLTDTIDIGRGKAICGCAKHRQTPSRVPDRDGLGVGPQDPIAQDQQACTLVDILGLDRRIDSGVVEGKPIQPQGFHQMMRDERREGGWSAAPDAERARRVQERGEKAVRLVVVGESPNGILMAVIEEYPGEQPQMTSQLVQLDQSLGGDENSLALT